MKYHIDKYLKESTSSDPNKYKRKQIFDKDLNKNMPHPYHYHDGLFKDIHPDWKSRAVKELNTNKLPAQSTFDKYRKAKHSYIKRRDESDCSACHYRFNGKNMLSALLYMLKHQQHHMEDCPNKSATSLFLLMTQSHHVIVHHVKAAKN